MLEHQTCCAGSLDEEGRAAACSTADGEHAEIISRRAAVSRLLYALSARGQALQVSLHLSSGAAKSMKEQSWAHSIIEQAVFGRLFRCPPPAIAMSLQPSNACATCNSWRCAL